jgi:hypothetical protein
MAESRKRGDHASLDKQSGLVTGYVHRQSKRRPDEKYISWRPAVHDNPTVRIFFFNEQRVQERRGNVPCSRRESGPLVLQSSVTNAFCCRWVQLIRWNGCTFHCSKRTMCRSLRLLLVCSTFANETSKSHNICTLGMICTAFFSDKENLEHFIVLYTIIVRRSESQTDDEVLMLINGFVQLDWSSLLLASRDWLLV